MTLEVLVKEKNIKVCNEMKIADKMGDRLMGLMFKKEMIGYDGLLIDPCNSIHTFFMRFDIDVLFIDVDNKIVQILRSMNPWKMSWIYFKSKKVLELPGGSLDPSIEIGDTLEIKCLS